MDTVGVHGLGFFAATVFVLNATPGVDLLLTLATTLKRGVPAGLAVATGICAGCIVHTLGAAFGLAALMAASAQAFMLVKWAGAAYLVWVGLGMFREAASAARDSAAAGAEATTAGGPTDGSSTATLLRQGFLTNVLNPKVAIFFLALLPQFIDAGAPHKTLAFLFLGGWFIAQSWVFLAVFVNLVAPLRRWSPGRVARGRLNAAGGGLFFWLAGRLALVDHG